MRILNDRFEVEGFFRRVRHARSRVLFLDYDGTLAPLVVERDRAHPYPGVGPILEGLSGLPRHRIVMVTGRPARQLAALLPLAPGPTIWGSHGMEELTQDGRLRMVPVAAEVRRLVDRETVRLETALGAAHVERKPTGVAVHVRGLSAKAAAEILDGVRGPWRELAQRHPLTVRAFDGGLELCGGQRHKGDVVRRVLEEHVPPVAAAFLGDDETDEDAFRAMRGRGAAILVRPQLRPTSADLWLTPPDELLGFLERWRSASGSDA